MSILILPSNNYNDMAPEKWDDGVVSVYLYDTLYR